MSLRLSPVRVRSRHSLDRRISAANFVESAVVIDASRDPVASRRFDEFVQRRKLSLSRLRKLTLESRAQLIAILAKAVAIRRS